RKGQDHIGLSGNHLLGKFPHARAAGRIAIVDADVASQRPSQSSEGPLEFRDPGPHFGIVRGQADQCADATDAVSVLSPRRLRPRRRGAEQHDDFAATDHSITSSARASTVSGTVRPRALAVFRLITSSYLVGACTGRSAGFVPFRMRSTYPAAGRN